MIIGIGHDMCDIQRIEKTLQTYGDRFLNRCFTPAEIAKAKRRSVMAPTLAKRFAAKEAASKALGTGFRQGVFWRDLEVVNLPSGQPTMRFHNGAAARLQAICPSGHTPFVHLTLTDEYPHAIAHILIEARPL